MPSAANAKSEKPASSEAADNTPIKQIMTLIEHKIRNLEKRKSKLSSYRELQKAGKELNGDQKVAVAKYDEVAQTLEFARDLSKNVSSIAVSAEREAKKQAKRDIWIRYTADTTKIREVILILDCLVLLGKSEVREDFLNGNNGAAKLTEDDLRILDDLYPEVSPKHDINEEGNPGFHAQTVKAAEHLYAIIDGKPKEILGTTYAHIKEIVTKIQECGYFDKTPESATEAEVEGNHVTEEVEEPVQEILEEVEPTAPMYAPPMAIPTAPAPTVVPAPGYPLRQLPPITLQEVEHAYFSQQYPQQRPISEVIGSQNFFFLQESEIDSPVGTPQPPMMNQASPPAAIPTQTFTNQHFVQIPPNRIPEAGNMPMPPQPHFPPHPEHFTGVPIPMPGHPQPHPQASHPMPQQAHHQAILTQPQHIPSQIIHPEPVPQHSVEQSSAEEHKSPTPLDDKKELEDKESRSPEREDDGERKSQGQGDGQNRFRRYRGNGRGAPNGYRGRGNFQNRQNNDGYHNRHGDYQNRSKDGYHNRQYNDNYQNRHKDYQSRGGNDGYYGNGDTNDNHHQNDNGGRDRYNDNAQGYQGGFKSRGRGGPRGASRGASRPPRPQYNRKQDNAE
ncbi:unnamed protein product [Leptosia nina]|uniref:Caprin-1 dimerization domain-containing protein n=1 Tax=Leptosia nina TaxID=320188 RepID=A0AAV1JU52_9NEOP